MFKARNKEEINLEKRQIKLAEEIKTITKENKKLEKNIVETSAECKEMYHNQKLIEEIGDTSRYLIYTHLCTSCNTTLIIY